MPFQIVRNDITRIPADVIVNTANPFPVYGYGTDTAVYRAAGVDELLAERRKIGNIERGECAVTPAFNLPAKYIIHTVGPKWRGGEAGEADVLRSCYRKSLAKAAELGAESVVFPLISTGSYGFPKEEALNIALDEIGRFLMQNDIDVILAVFDRESFEVSRRLFDGIDDYIDEHGAGEARDRETRRARDAIPRGQAAEEKAASAVQAPFPDLAGKSLEEVLGVSGETFQERLFRLIDERGLSNVAFYRKANIGKKVFSSILSNKDYRPKKKTAVACAVALELDMPQMQDLLARAGIALSASDPFDLIISYFVTNRIYNILTINIVLDEYGQQILGETAR